MQGTRAQLRQEEHVLHLQSLPIAALEVGTGSAVILQLESRCIRSLQEHLRHIPEKGGKSGHIGPEVKGVLLGFGGALEWTCDQETSGRNFGLWRKQLQTNQHPQQPRVERDLPLLAVVGRGAVLDVSHLQKGSLVARGHPDEIGNADAVYLLNPALVPIQHRRQDQNRLGEVERLFRFCSSPLDQVFQLFQRFFEPVPQGTQPPFGIALLYRDQGAARGADVVQHPGLVQLPPGGPQASGFRLHSRLSRGALAGRQKAETEPPLALPVADVFPHQGSGERPREVPGIRPNHIFFLARIDTPPLLFPSQQGFCRHRRVEEGRDTPLRSRSLQLEHVGVSRDNVRRFLQVAGKGLGNPVIIEETGHLLGQQGRRQDRAEGVE